MATFKAGLQGALYIDGTLINFITSLEVSIDRDVAEEAVMGQEYKIKRVGAYGAEFTGAALVDLDSKQLLDLMLAQSTTTASYAIYPDRTDLSNYWYFDGQMQSWSASGEPGGIWAGDFGGIVAGEFFATGFESAASASPSATLSPSASASASGSASASASGSASPSPS